MIHKRFVQSYFIIAAILLTIYGSFVMIFDPYFVYHKPIKKISYKLRDQRYINNGILRHFDYDAVILGTSMSENFKSSEFDDLFQVNSVKIPFSGASFRELGEQLSRAIDYNPNIKKIIIGLDGNGILVDKNHHRYDNIPYYLYDNNFFNDAPYLFNKSIVQPILNNIIIPTLKKSPSTTFDEYSFWATFHKNLDDFNMEKVLKNYTRPNKIDNKVDIGLSEKQKHIIYENIHQNIISSIKSNPQIEFYLFFPPYSILYFDMHNQLKVLKEKLEMYHYAAELLLDFPNVHLYSFFDNYNVITNLDNYKDLGHYSDDINSKIIKDIKTKDGLLTKENYQQHFDSINKFYIEYDYDRIFLKN